MRRTIKSIRKDTIVKKNNYYKPLSEKNFFILIKVISSNVILEMYNLTINI